MELGTVDMAVYVKLSLSSRDSYSSEQSQALNTIADNY